MIKCIKTVHPFKRMKSPVTPEQEFNFTSSHDTNVLVANPIASGVVTSKGILTRIFCECEEVQLPLNALPLVARASMDLCNNHDIEPQVHVTYVYNVQNSANQNQDPIVCQAAIQTLSEGRRAGKKEESDLINKSLLALFIFLVVFIAAKVIAAIAGSDSYI